MSLPPPPSAGFWSFLSSGKFWAIAVPVIGLLVAVISIYVAHGDAKTNPPSSVAQVTISLPATIQASQDVSVEGTVTGLVGGDLLWVVTKPEIGDGRYYLAQSGAVTDHDGDWKFVDIHVGDDSDKGHNIVFFALQANRSCTQVLATVPADSNGSQTIAQIPDGCVVRADRSVAVAR